MTTTGWKVRQTLKLVMAVASLIGITGMYLRQVRQIGLLGYLVFGAGYLMTMSVEVVGGYVLPSIAHSAPGYVNDVLAAATGGIVTGDLGQMQSLIVASGIAYPAGGFIFGIALFRADVLSRWAAALLAVGTVATIAIPLLPQVDDRLFAVPTGVALIGLGYSLWRGERTPAARPVAGPAGSQLDRAGAR